MQISDLSTTIARVLQQKNVLDKLFYTKCSSVDRSNVENKHAKHERHQEFLQGGVRFSAKNTFCLVFSAKKERKKTAIFKKFQMKTKLGVLQVEIKIVHFRMPMVKKKISDFSSAEGASEKK